MKEILTLLIVFVFITGCASIPGIEDYNEYAFDLVTNGLYEEALFYLLKADSLTPDYRIKNNIALCYEALGERQLAQKYYQEALKLRETKALKDNYADFKKDQL
ncbi:MAG TPA: tetratricopeptide repeat protein [Candidatus Mcinerneyibacteriales bacterium]|nr:tetratricopeptide repeat protein [Candidatus Mcinerneyibacteriales bacterium]HPE19753.1 tetratricopeptide repeat protein [Candidatus Mcinerneyibacteriales bacterium]HPJ70208.1 tetratricopeptide repeat protein [Candidatus Mcinerneyibacteriales bacterium]HPQ89537.1 tetratricopeptide repeat protein [Candidatus Mcinerneyibacteriales bacterium]